MGGNHTLGRNHAIIGSCCVIVKDNCNKSHEVDDIEGGSFQEDATNRHVAILASKLVG
jgi:hypothetical protein